MQGLIIGGGEVLLNEAPDGRVQLDVRLDGETVWLTQAQMAKLFGRERSVITKHLRNVFREGGIVEKSNVQNLHIASSDKPVAYYNLDVIISVGYRVKSQRGTQFRIWATRTLKDHLLRGYTLNEKRLRERDMGEVSAVNSYRTRKEQHSSLMKGGRFLRLYNNTPALGDCCFNMMRTAYLMRLKRPVKPKAQAKPVGCTRRDRRVENVAN